MAADPMDEVEGEFEGVEEAVEPDVRRVNQPLAPGLYLVATPIGNLEDITLRALRVLRMVDRVACEDTRQTQKLLHHFGIKVPTVSYHLHNESSRAEELVAELRAGGRIAVVSDAGTPGIADPGAQIAALAIAAGVAVYPVPGANAAVNALIASGLPSERFTFHGFLPAKAGARKTALEAVRAFPEGFTHVFYEAPHRIAETLSEVEEVFGSAQPVALARELTKLHEEFLRGAVGEVRAGLAGRAALRGEMVLLLGPVVREAAAGSRGVAEEVAELMKTLGLSEKDALKRVAKERGLGKSEAYRELQRERGR
jgi:16S rRNA (cytidine1402-2'-O)-methyltransferase